jgi:hypothetical protein
MKIIKLTRDKEAIVDDEDYEYLNQWKWYCSSTGYANRASARDKNYKQKKILMHRIIMKAPKSMQVDHIDSNRLNNSKSNLRLVTKQQNHMNRRKLNKKTSSKYKGVSYYSIAKKWVATIYYKNKRYHLGYFNFEAEAVAAYNLAAVSIHGEYARLNQL